MIVKALLENTTQDPAFQTEHGLSLYIEANGHKILFDTGHTDLFAENAQKLNVDLSQVEFAVLSHAHYDHGGGIPSFLSLNSKALVYVSQYAFGEYLSNDGRDIGIDQALRGNPRLILVMDYQRIAEGLELFSDVDRPYHQPIDSGGMFVRRDGVVVPEDFRHEQYLLITEGNKRVLISGCSHKGIVNIEHWFNPDVLIGGFHFMNLDPKGSGKAVMDPAAKELLSFDTVYYTCHCTGVAQFEYLKPQMQDRLFYLSAGQEITL